MEDKKEMKVKKKKKHNKQKTWIKIEITPILLMIMCKVSASQLKDF